MGKRSRIKARDRATEVADSPSTYNGEEVAPRQPCPCGSGRRFKACHGAADGPAPRLVVRPFESMPSECDVIALRELVPAATAELRLTAHPERTVRLCTLLPGAAPAMVRDSGEIWLGLQVQHGYGDPARDMGAVLQKALDAEPGVVGLTADPGDGPRIQDLITGTGPDGALKVEVHEGFDYWFADVPAEERTAAVDAALQQANDTAFPTSRLTEVDAAYWTDVGTKEHLRWAMPEPEDELLAALARLHVSGDDVLVEGARLVGMFRAHGLLVPVWDLPLGTGAEALEEPAAEFKKKLDVALADTTALTAEERSARSGLANRQVTIR